MTMRTFPLRNGYTVPMLANSVASWLSTGCSMPSQIFYDEDGSTIVQGRITGASFKRFVGMDRAVKIHLTECGDVVNVEVGDGAWVDKCLVFTLSMVVLWPLTVTSSVGFFKQRNLHKNVFNYVERCLA